MYKLSRRSIRRLQGVRPELVSVVELAIKITPVDFAVLEGVRTMKRQRKLVAAGASKTINSLHLDGRAVDLGAYVAGEVRWDWPLYYQISHAMKAAANELGIYIAWGGDWESFRDGPHFELDGN